MNYLLVEVEGVFNESGWVLLLSPTETPVDVFGVRTKIEHELKTIVATNVIDIIIFFIIFWFLYWINIKRH